MHFVLHGEAIERGFSSLFSVLSALRALYRTDVSVICTNGSALARLLFPSVFFGIATYLVQVFVLTWCRFLFGS